MFHIFFVLCLFALCCGEDHYREVFDLPEGSSCSSKGLEGKCTTIDHCPSAKDAIRQKNYPPICSFQGMKPIVCCTNCVLNHITTDSVKNLGLQSRFNQSSIAKQKCLHYLKILDYPCNFPSIIPHMVRSSSDNNSYGTMESSALENADSRPQGDLISRLKRHARKHQNSKLFHPSKYPPRMNLTAFSSRMTTFRSRYPHMNAKLIDPPKYPPGMNVTGLSAGVAAYRRQYPHMALLGYGDDLRTAQWLCGGSVISEKFVLTAAHCIASPNVGPVKFIVLGILKRSDSPEYWQTHKVSRIIAHPEYKPPFKYNDIALLETENTIKFDLNVLPACLPIGPESAMTAEATGWGALGHHQGLADVLQTVKLQRYEEEKCSELYPKHRHLLQGYNHTTQMCYGDTREAKDTCEGDSGGPLQTANEFLRCAYTVLGVTSYGRQCGISAGSGMYTRVYHYVPWIESIVWPSESPQP